MCLSVDLSQYKSAGWNVDAEFELLDQFNAANLVMRICVAGCFSQHATFLTFCSIVVSINFMTLLFRTIFSTQAVWQHIAFLSRIYLLPLQHFINFEMNDSSVSKYFVYRNDFGVHSFLVSRCLLFMCSLKYVQENVLKEESSCTGFNYWDHALKTEFSWPSTIKVLIDSNRVKAPKVSHEHKADLN